MPGRTRYVLEKEGAKVIGYSPKTKLYWAWFGGHGLHGYNNTDEVAFGNSGNFAKDSMTESEAKAAINKILNSVSRQSDWAIDEEWQKRILDRGKEYKKKKILMV